MARRPAPTEYPSWFERYVRLVDDVDDLAAAMGQQIDETLAFYRSLPEAQVSTPYAPGKWTVKEVIGHLSDTERVMQYRALGVARGDTASFPPFEQDDYAQTAGHGARTWGSLLEEFACVRGSSIHLFRHLDDAALDRVGTVSQQPTTARGLGYVILGHERHHLAILKERLATRGAAS
jgi:hypothetical protein